MLASTECCGIGASDSPNRPRAESSIGVSLKPCASQPGDPRSCFQKGLTPGSIYLMHEVNNPIRRRPCIFKRAIRALLVSLGLAKSNPLIARKKKPLRVAGGFSDFLAAVCRARSSSSATYSPQESTLAGGHLRFLQRRDLTRVVFCRRFADVRPVS